MPDTLNENEDVDAAEAWLAEIDCRAAEVEEGTAELEEWEVVRERLARRRSSK
ncbi:MAG TPA: addiction module protein [Polyangia bacterium]|jgi:hypothetical protein|nr:addiction module protein [Polyangia bacterium]